MGPAGGGQSPLRPWALPLVLFWLWGCTATQVNPQAGQPTNTSPVVLSVPTQVALPAEGAFSFTSPAVVSLVGRTRPNVAVRLLQTGQPDAAAESDENGDYIIAEIPLGPGEALFEVDTADRVGDFADGTLDGRIPVSGFTRPGAQVTLAVANTSTTRNGRADPSGAFVFDDVAFNEGPNAFTLTVDAQGAQPMRVTYDFTLDTTPPVVEFTSLVSGQVFDGPVVSISGRLDERNVTIEYTDPETGAAVSFLNTSRLFDIPFFSFPEGHHSLEMRFIDSVGNLTRRILNFEVDLSDPPLVIALPEVAREFFSGQFEALTQNELTEVVGFTSPGALVEAELLSTGDTYSQIADVDGSFSIPPFRDLFGQILLYARGRQAIRILITDAAGRQRDVQLTLELPDAGALPPPLWIEAPQVGASLPASQFNADCLAGRPACPVGPVAGTLEPPIEVRAHTGTAEPFTPVTFSLDGRRVAPPEGASRILRPDPVGLPEILCLPGDPLVSYLELRAGEPASTNVIELLGDPSCDGGVLPAGCLARPDGTRLRVIHIDQKVTPVVNCPAGMTEVDLDGDASGVDPTDLPAPWLQTEGVLCADPLLGCPVPPDDPITQVDVAADGLITLTFAGGPDLLAARDGFPIHAGDTLTLQLGTQLTRRTVVIDQVLSATELRTAPLVSGAISLLAPGFVFRIDRNVPFVVADTVSDAGGVLLDGPGLPQGLFGFGPACPTASCAPLFSQLQGELCLPPNPLCPGGIEIPEVQSLSLAAGDGTLASPIESSFRVLSPRRATIALLRPANAIATTELEVAVEGFVVGDPEVAVAQINGRVVDVDASGRFILERLPLEPGTLNRIQVLVLDSGGNVVTAEREVLQTGSNVVATDVDLEPSITGTIVAGDVFFASGSFSDNADVIGRVLASGLEGDVFQVACGASQVDITLPPPASFDDALVELLASGNPSILYVVDGPAAGTSVEINTNTAPNQFDFAGGATLCAPLARMMLIQRNLLIADPAPPLTWTITGRVEDGADRRFSHQLSASVDFNAGAPIAGSLDIELPFAAFQRNEPGAVDTDTVSLEVRTAPPFIRPVTPVRFFGADATLQASGPPDQALLTSLSNQFAVDVSPADVALVNPFPQFEDVLVRAGDLVVLGGGSRATTGDELRYYEVVADADPALPGELQIQSVDRFLAPDGLAIPIPPLGVEFSFALYPRLAPLRGVQVFPPLDGPAETNQPILTTKTRIDVAGFTNTPDAIVSVDGILSLSLPDGGFFVPSVPLAPGANSLEVVATDFAELQTVQTLSVFSDPNPPTFSLLCLARDTSTPVSDPNDPCREASLPPGAPVPVRIEPLPFPEDTAFVSVDTRVVELRGLALEDAFGSGVRPSQMLLNGQPINAYGGFTGANDPFKNLPGLPPFDCNNPSRGTGLFCEQLFLNRGTNDFVIEAIDRAGNRRTFDLIVNLDIPPPRFPQVAIDCMSDGFDDAGGFAPLTSPAGPDNGAPEPFCIHELPADPVFSDGDDPVTPLNLRSVREGFGFGDGTLTSFAGLLRRVPIEPGTVRITDGTLFVSDDGAGNLVGNVGAPSTVNYATGALAVDFSAPPAAGAALLAVYEPVAPVFSPAEDRLSAHSSITLTGRYLSEEGTPPALTIDGRPAIFETNFVPLGQVLVGNAGQSVITLDPLFTPPETLCRCPAGGCPLGAFGPAWGPPIVRQGDTLVLLPLATVQSANSFLYDVTDDSALCSAGQLTLGKSLLVDAAGMLVQFEYVWRLSGIEARNEGLNTVILQAVDSLGNVTVTPYSFVRDTEPPAVVIQGVVDGFKTSIVNPAVLFTDSSLCTSGLACPGGGFNTATAAVGAEALQIRIARLDANGESPADIGVGPLVTAGDSLNYGWALFTDDLSTLVDPSFPACLGPDPVRVGYDLSDLDGDALEFTLPAGYPDPLTALNPNTGAPIPALPLVAAPRVSDPLCPPDPFPQPNATLISLGLSEASNDPALFSTPFPGDVSCRDVVTGPPNPLPCEAREALGYRVTAEAHDRVGHGSLAETSFEVVVTPESRLLSGTIGLISDNPALINLLADNTGLRVLLLDRLLESGVLFNQNLALAELLGDFDTPGPLALEMEASGARSAFATLVGLLFTDPDGFGPGRAAIAVLLDVLRVLLDNGVLDDLLPILDNPFILVTCTAPSALCPLGPGIPGDGTALFTFLSDLMIEDDPALKTDTDGDGEFFRTLPGPIRNSFPLQQDILAHQEVVRRRSLRLRPAATPSIKLDTTVANPACPDAGLGAGVGTTATLAPAPVAGELDFQPVTNTEQVGTGTGALTRFAGALSQAPLLPLSVQFTDGVQIVTDDGTGGLIGAVGAGANRIDYAGGGFDFDFAAPPGVGVPVNATYAFENPVNIEPGDRIRVTSGACQGLEAIISSILSPDTACLDTSNLSAPAWAACGVDLEYEIFYDNGPALIQWLELYDTLFQAPLDGVQTNPLGDNEALRALAHQIEEFFNQDPAAAGAFDTDDLEAFYNTVFALIDDGVAFTGAEFSTALIDEIDALLAPQPTPNSPLRPVSPRGEQLFPLLDAILQGDPARPNFQPGLLDRFPWPVVFDTPNNAYRDMRALDALQYALEVNARPNSATGERALVGLLALVRELVDDPDDFARGINAAGGFSPPGTFPRVSVLEALADPLASVMQNAVFTDLVKALSAVLNPFDTALGGRSFLSDLSNWDETLLATDPPLGPRRTSDAIEQNPPLLRALGLISRRRLDTDLSGAPNSTALRGLSKALVALTTPIGLPGQGENLNPGYPPPVPDTAFVDTPVCRESFFNGRSPLEVIVPILDQLLEPLPVGVLAPGETPADALARGQDVLGRDRLTIILQGLFDDPHLDEPQIPNGPDNLDECAQPCRDVDGTVLADLPAGDGLFADRATVDNLSEVLNTLSRFGFDSNNKLTSIFDDPACVTGVPGGCPLDNRLLSAQLILVDLGLPLDAPFQIGSGPNGILRFEESLTQEAFLQLASFDQGEDAANYVLLLAARMAEDIAPINAATSLPPEAAFAPAALRALADPDGDGDPIPDGLVDDFLPAIRVLAQTGVARQVLDLLRAVRACGVDSANGNAELKGGIVFRSLLDATLDTLPALSGATTDGLCPGEGAGGRGNEGGVLDDNPLFNTAQSSSDLGVLQGGSQGRLSVTACAGTVCAMRAAGKDFRALGVGPGAHLCLLEADPATGRLRSPVQERCAQITCRPGDAGCLSANLDEVSFDNGTLDLAPNDPLAILTGQCPTLAEVVVPENLGTLAAGVALYSSPPALANRPVRPGSLRITTDAADPAGALPDADVFTDDGGGVLERASDGAPIGTVNYATGVWSLTLQGPAAANGTDDAIEATYSHYTQPAAGTAVLAEGTGVSLDGPGGVLGYGGTINGTPIVAGTLVLTAPGEDTFTDNGDGTLTRASDAAVAGTIHYTRGQWTLTLQAVGAGNTAEITADYNFDPGGCSYRVRMMREPYNGCRGGDPIELGPTLGSPLSATGQSHLDFILRSLRYLVGSVDGFIIPGGVLPPPPIGQGRLPRLLDVLVSPVPNLGGTGGDTPILLEVAPALSATLSELLASVPEPFESLLERTARLSGEAIVDLGLSPTAGTLPFDLYPTPQVLYRSDPPAGPFVIPPSPPGAPPREGNGVNDAFDLALLGINAVLDQLEIPEGQNGVPRDPNPQNGECSAISLPNCPVVLSLTDPHFGYSDDPAVLTDYLGERLPIWAERLAPGVQILLESFDEVRRAGEFDPLYPAVVFDPANPLLDCQPNTARPCAGTTDLVAAVERLAYTGNCRPHPAGGPRDVNCRTRFYVPVGGEAPRPAGSFGLVFDGVVDDGPLQLLAGTVNRLLDEWLVPPNDPAAFAEGVLHRERVDSQFFRFNGLTNLLQGVREIVEDGDLATNGQGRVIDSISPITVRLANREFAGQGAPNSADSESAYDVLLELVQTLITDPTDCDADVLGGASGIQRGVIGAGADANACQDAAGAGSLTNALDAVFRDAGVNVVRPINPLFDAELFDQLLGFFDADPTNPDLIEKQLPFAGHLTLLLAEDPTSCSTPPFAPCSPRLLQNQPPPNPPFAIYDPNTTVADALVADLQFLIPNSAARCPMGAPFVSVPGPYSALCDPLVSDDLNHDGVVGTTAGAGLCGTDSLLIGPPPCVGRIGNGPLGLLATFDEIDNDPDGSGALGAAGSIGFTSADQVVTLFGVDGVDEALLDGLADVLADDDPAFVVDHENVGPGPIFNRFTVRAPGVGVSQTAIDLLDALGELLLKTQLGGP